MRSKNILLIVDDYLPHSIKVAAKMMHELALEFERLGHHATVLTPRPNQGNPFMIEELDGVKVIYLRTGAIKNVALHKRLINEVLLSSRAKRKISWKEALPELDLIVYYSPSIFWGNLVKYLKKEYKVPAYLILRDLFPQWIVDNGMIGAKSWKAKFLRFFEKINYEAADRIGLMSYKNLALFKEEIYRNEVKSEVLFNWSATKPHILKKDMKESLGLNQKIVFFYGGAIGPAQGIEVLVELAVKLKDIKEAHFLFLGRGDHEEIVKKAAEEHENISFHDAVNQEEYLDYLASFDVGMFSLSQHHQSHNFPGKLLGYMNAKLPVLGVVNNGNDLIELVNSKEAAFVYDYNNIQRFIESARLLATDPDIRASSGGAGYKFLAKYFSVRAAADQILGLLKP